MPPARRAHNRKDAEPGNKAPGYIRPDELYTVDEIFVRLRLGADKIRDAEKEGLNALPFGRCKYILGADLIQHIVAKARRV